VSRLAAIRRGRSLGAPDFRGKGSSLGNKGDTTATHLAVIIDTGSGKYRRLYKTRHILLSDSANCTVLGAVVLTQYRRVTDRRTDRQTDGNVVASTAFSMRALRRDAHFEDVKGGVEPWLMARWKARIKLPIRHN